jgi:hypothetical protein
MRDKVTHGSENRAMRDSVTHGSEYTDMRDSVTHGSKTQPRMTALPSLTALPRVIVARRAAADEHRNHA